MPWKSIIVALRASTHAHVGCAFQLHVQIHGCIKDSAQLFVYKLMKNIELTIAEGEPDIFCLVVVESLRSTADWNVADQ